jgi:Gly-Xaa carboxypeptidase
MEKTLPIAQYRQPHELRARSWSRAIISVSLLCLAVGGWFYNPQAFSSRSFEIALKHHSKPEPKCHQPSALHPPDNDGLNAMYNFLSTPTFENASILRLSGAVQVRTESFDDLGAIGDDKRWDVFYGFHDYLKATFPHLHEELKVEKVNTHGLLYTWLGSDETLKPLVLMAHQDVVPVEEQTVDSWTFPPWSGHFDGKYIWGRGASDCKNSLIGMMETVELLLDAGFQPKRTIVLSFGFDEECSGYQGAGHLGPFLLARYGENGVAAVVDEGEGYTEAFGRGFAVPGVAEKGYVDVEVVVRTKGGHSSIPPDHTSIGILSELITSIESQQYRTFLDDANPFLEFLTCSATHAPEFPKKLRKLLKERKTPKKCKAQPDHLAIEAAKISKAAKYLMQTSQAVDVIGGGVKVNALPETAKAIVNHRINIGEHPETVFHHLAHLARPIAKKYNLTLHAFDNHTEAYNSISLSSNKPLRVAPVTPTNIDVNTPYKVLAGTVRATFGEDVIVTPFYMTGNTDTRHVWPLTRHIFRFGPGYVKEAEFGLGNIHTVDEHIAVTNHFKLVKFYTLFIRNMDNADLDSA